MTSMLRQQNSSSVSCWRSTYFFPLHTAFKRAGASRINLSLVHFLLYF
ncbi:hypothetical protein D920_00943 [Enterococcus faecalis 13-SD-W-01]|nr:hypothetical protein D920_00943 [Enterococcus faecalis 13-SD-W-01]